MCVQQFEQLKPLDGPHWLLEPGHHAAGQFCLHFFWPFEDIGPKCISGIQFCILLF